MRSLQPFQNKQRIRHNNKARQRYTDSSPHEYAFQDSTDYNIDIDDEDKKKAQKHFYMSDLQQRKHTSSLYREEDEPIHLTLIKIGSTILFLIIMALLVYLIQWLFTFNDDSSSTNTLNMNRPLMQEKTVPNLKE